RRVVLSVRAGLVVSLQAASALALRLRLPAGSALRAGNFLLLAQKKVTKEEGLGMQNHSARSSRLGPSRHRTGRRSSEPQIA
ncbi:MAG: hypothetical protein KF683_22520, partial [Rubrivivax sp.]|nr:hypothetical protein [Rubrivivax sp.]